MKSACSLHFQNCVSKGRKYYYFFCLMENLVLERGSDAVEKGDEPLKATDGTSSGKALACDSALQTTAHFPEIPGPIDKDPEIEPEKGICPVGWWYVFHWGPEHHYLVEWCRNTESSRDCFFSHVGPEPYEHSSTRCQRLEETLILSCVQPRKTTGFLFSHKTCLDVLCHWAARRK